MKAEELKHRLMQLSREQVPFPGEGSTSTRFQRMKEAGHEDLGLAKLIEAHWDAVAILAEAGRAATPDAIYGVWASELPGKSLKLETCSDGYTVSGMKMFCSGVGLIDRALVTIRLPEERLVELDLRAQSDKLTIDLSQWAADAFSSTQTGSVSFDPIKVSEHDLIGGVGWYTSRPGFWHGACGPAACWAGGVAGLLDFAMFSERRDPHTLAHLGAMSANVWSIQATLDAAGKEIDANPRDVKAAHARALKVRHVVEHSCTDTLRRFARAYGPFPLSMNMAISKRYREADLYLRQSHAERDLEALGRACLKMIAG